MRDLRAKLKRQTEILGLIYDSDKIFTIADLAFEFNCEELTIKRDLRSLREEGIIIHSRGSRGVVLEGEIDFERLNSMISSYAAIAINTNTVYKSTRLLVKKHGALSLTLITRIQIAIEKGLCVRVEYLKQGSSTFKERLIEPQLIYEADKAWRLLALHDGVLKQFVFNRIFSVKITSIQYKKIPSKDLNQLFINSFKSWTGKSEYNVKMHFLKPWSDIFRTRILIENQKITEKDDGTFILEMKVNSLNELAGWIVSRGKGIIVISPDELKKIVIEIAEGTLANYE